MPNKYYIQGVRKERKIMNEARAEGLISFRSAGSHSPIDVCIINRNKRVIRFIQCKPSHYTEKQKQKLIDEMKGLENAYIVTFEVL